MIVQNFYSNALLSIICLVACHLIGDYVLQIDYLAKTKGSNPYHMFAHCFLYCVPFLFVFGLSWKLAVVFALHCIVDPIKARGIKGWKLPYWADQALHYLTLCVYLIP